MYRLVERYDGDGIDDMPRLLRPILYYEIESEAALEVFWQGSKEIKDGMEKTVEEYGKVLKAARDAARRANENVKIILAGLNLRGFADDGADPETVEQRIISKLNDPELPDEWREIFRRGYEFSKLSLGLHEYFDIVEFHANRNYKGVSGQIKWIRHEMRKRGYEKPIWVGDVTGAPILWYSKKLDQDRSDQGCEQGKPADIRHEHPLGRCLQRPTG